MAFSGFRYVGYKQRHTGVDIEKAGDKFYLKIGEYRSSEFDKLESEPVWNAIKQIEAFQKTLEDG